MSDKINIRVGVGVFVQDKEGRVLLEHRRDCGLWCLPGGSVDSGETVRETAVREVKEETGLDVQTTELVGIYSDPRIRMVTYPDTGTSQLVDIVLCAKILNGNLTCSPESLDVRFFEKEKLPALLPRALKPIQDALSGKRGVVS